MRSFEYTVPNTIGQAVAALGPGTRALAGGTDLLTLMKADLAAPQRLVNVKTLLPRGIEARPEGLEIGALTTLAEIEQHAVIAEGYSALAQAAALAASPQIRNLATIGGNLLQRPRCWYYRNARIDCWLKGGADCPAREGENRSHALFGGGPCYAAHPSDLAPALLAFDAALRAHGRGGERTIELADFFALPTPGRRRETTLAHDELILGLRLPPHPAGSHARRDARRGRSEGSDSRLRGTRTRRHQPPRPSPVSDSERRRSGRSRYRQPRPRRRRAGCRAPSIRPAR